MRCVLCPLCCGTGVHRIFYDLENYYLTPDAPDKPKDRKWWQYEKQITIEGVIWETGGTWLGKTSVPADTDLSLDLQRLAAMLEAELPTRDYANRVSPQRPRNRLNGGLDGPPREFFIALRNEKVEAVSGGVLSYNDFGTHGYIPVAVTPIDAVEALFDADHQARVSYPRDYQIYRIFNPSEHANYIKRDKLYPGRYKLFFEVGLPGVTWHTEPIGHTQAHEEWKKLPVTWRMEMMKDITVG